MIDLNRRGTLERKIVRAIQEFVDKNGEIYKSGLEDAMNAVLSVLRDWSPNEEFDSYLNDLIIGGFKSAMDIHGPVTKHNANSSAKRIIGNIKQWNKS